MYCENKNHVLDLYFMEGNEDELKEAREHLESCESCREYFAEIKDSMNLLDNLENEEPDAKVFDNILSKVSDSVPKPAKQNSGIQVIPILQIAFGQILLFAIIYILNLKLSLSSFWIKISDYWFFQYIGSMGIAIIIVLSIGSFVTLSLAPILLFEAKDKKSFT